MPAPSSGDPNEVVPAIFGMDLIHATRNADPELAKIIDPAGWSVVVSAVLSDEEITLLCLVKILDSIDPLEKQINLSASQTGIIQNLTPWANPGRRLN